MAQSGPHVQLKLKKEKRRENQFFFLPILGNYGSESERGEKSSSFSLRSTEIWWSEFVDPRFKVHLLDEGYAWVADRTRPGYPLQDSPGGPV